MQLQIARNLKDFCKFSGGFDKCLDIRPDMGIDEWSVSVEMGEHMIRQSYKITALYCRIDHGRHSVMSASYAQNQQKRLLFYAREHGFQNLQIFSDIGYSGFNTNRPAYQKMLAAIRANEVSNVVVYELSRLNRVRENQRQLLLELEAHNVIIHSIKEQVIGLDNPIFMFYRKQAN